jgi:hypothetical protein
MRTRTHRKSTALICLGAYLFTVIAPGGWLVLCIGFDGHRAIELPYPTGAVAKGADGGGPSNLDKPANDVWSIDGAQSLALSCSSIAGSNVLCLDTPVVSALLPQGFGMPKAGQVGFKPLAAVLPSPPATAAPHRLLGWSRLAGVSLDLTSLDMLRVVILQI